MRVKSYYEHFYTQRAVFDEQEILKNLNPSLHQQIVLHVLEETLGRVPVFEKLSPDFKMAVCRSQRLHLHLASFRPSSSLTSHFTTHTGLPPPQALINGAR